MTEERAGSVYHLLKQAYRVYLRPYWREQILLVLAICPSVALATYLPLCVRTLVDVAIPNRDGHLLLTSLGLLTTLLVVSTGGEILQAFLRAGFGNEFKKDLRLRVFQHLQQLPLSFHEQTQPGELAALFAKEIVSLNDAYRNLIVRGFRAALQITAALVVLLDLSWRATLVVVFFIPFVIRDQNRSLRRTEQADYQEKLDDARVVHAVQDQMISMPLVRAFGLGESSTRSFSRNVLDREGPPRTVNTYDRAFTRRVLDSPDYIENMMVVNLQQNISYLIALCAGAALAYAGYLSVGTFSALLGLVWALGQALGNFTSFLQESVTAANSLERIEEVLRLPPTAQDAPDARELRKVRGHIVFEHVSFGYLPGRLQISDLSFVLPPKGTVAFVGRSGCGKSTILSLMLRFYSPSQGRVVLDGHNLNEIRLSSLRGNVGVVLQDLILFNVSITENLLMVKPDATQEEIETATRAAEVHESIMQLPMQYKTVVGERGKRLSPGQRQRVALARALLCQPQILILDEVTSSLDPVAEAAIHRTLRTLAQERTIIMMTHRLAAVSEVDRLLVIDRGALVQQGTHESLLHSPGLYRQLWASQSGFVISQDGRHAEITAERLRAISLFEDLDADQLETLCKRFTSEHCEPGETICQEGQPGDSFFIIVRGRASVFTQGQSEVPLHVATLQDGDYFGEDALLDGSTYTTDVVADYETLVMLLRREAFQSLLDTTQSVRQAVEETALGRSLTLFGRRGRRPSRLPKAWDQITQGLA